MVKIKYSAISTGLLMAMLVFLVGTALPAMPLPASNAVDNNAAYAFSTKSCQEGIEKGERNQAIHLDNNKAISMAVQNPEFQFKIKGYSSKFNSIFNMWNTANCNPVWESVNVVYTLSNSTGLVKNVVVTLNPELTKVEDVTEQITGNYDISPNWGGYAFYGLQNGGLVSTLKATTTFNTPTVYVPDVSISNCVSQPICDAATWVGIWDGYTGPSSHFIQAGTDGQVTCIHSGCNKDYIGWYQFYTSGSAAVTCFNDNPSDSITATVTNDADYGGASDKYDISLTDNTQPSLSCSVTGQTFSMSPNYGAVIVERAALPYNCDLYSYCSLAKFTSTTFSGSIDYCNPNCGTHSFGSPDTEIDMKNTYNGIQYTNIQDGSISGGAFTQTWLTSKGT
jgi:hypothetical protein